jgi:homoaconitate hydratase family protein
MAGKTIAQKVLGSKSDVEDPSTGDHVTVRPDWAIAHDLSIYPSRERMHELGFDEVARPEDVLLVFDHYVPSDNADVSTHMNETEAWVDEQGIEHFYPSGHGICHNVVTENGHVAPGQLILGADSHTTTHGAFGAFATGIGHTDLGYLLGTGELWVKVPESRKLVVDDTLPDGTSAKDLALAVMGELTAKGAIYESIEFHGDAVGDLAMHERATLSNLGVELGAMAAVVPADEVTEAYLDGRTDEEWDPVHPDADAEYDATTHVDAADVEPLVAEPARVDNVGTVRENAGTDVDQVFVGTCNNSRYEDLAAFASMLAGESVARGTDLVVVPGSRHALERLNEEGLSNEILRAGGMIEPPGCGPCFGAHGGILGEGDTCLGTMNRNFPGRMGPGDIYIGSPQTAAATAMYGELTDPREVL